MQSLVEDQYLLDEWRTFVIYINTLYNIGKYLLEIIDGREDMNIEFTCSFHLETNNNLQFLSKISRNAPVVTFSHNINPYTCEWLCVFLPIFS